MVPFGHKLHLFVLAVLLKGSVVSEVSRRESGGIDEQSRNLWAVQGPIRHLRGALAHSHCQ